jgi:hypothetical protein
MSDAPSKKPSKRKTRQRSKTITELPDDKAIRKLFPKKAIKELKRIVDRSTDSEEPTE